MKITQIKEQQEDKRGMKPDAGGGFYLVWQQWEPNLSALDHFHTTSPARGAFLRQLVAQHNTCSIMSWWTQVIHCATYEASLPLQIQNYEQWGRNLKKSSLNTTTNPKPLFPSLSCQTQLRLFGPNMINGLEVLRHHSDTQRFQKQPRFGCSGEFEQSRDLTFLVLGWSWSRSPQIHQPEGLLRSTTTSLAFMSGTVNKTTLCCQNTEVSGSVGVFPSWSKSVQS